MLSRLDLRGADADLGDVLVHTADDGSALDAVREIIGAVRAGGDDALRELTERFDGCRVDDLRVPSDELRAALDGAPSAFRAALDYARDEITAYHEAQVGDGVRVERDGVLLRELVVPVDRAGLYVPGGRAAYPSTVLMTAIPARVAGVPELALCVPPDRDGRIPAATLAAAALVGVDEVYRVGGAQAIAALAYGTESIRPVDVVVGPGNVYVTLAKREVAGVVGIESLSGPSEVVVVADHTADPALAAADLLAQAEHGPDGAAILVTWDEEVADAVETAVATLLADAPRRAEIESTLVTGGRTIVVDGPEAAVAVANTIAPEHLELMTADPEALVAHVRNAGAVFCGPWSPAAVGDYVAGVNHVLPTARTARFASALRVDTYRKHVHVVTLDRDALARVTPYVRAFAEVEGLDAHGRSVTLRGTE
ncbi:MAG TPA: histidinol dehydrogenase [Acidimicrobiia bacterium]|nr:histidinol dehydrogenase [Acidimicrobiia bacterium]